MLDPFVRFNPMHGNPLKTREDVSRSLTDLFEPLVPFFKMGGARVALGSSAAHFDRAAADLEGFSRPLWGLAPLAAGGGALPHWEMIAEGLANGCDPAHPEYWGAVTTRDQRMVELAALGFALRMAPDKLWAPQTARAKANIAKFLTDGRNLDFVPNNWMFFRVMVDTALDHLGLPYDRSMTEAYLDRLESYDIGGGWYRDGLVRRVDHYIPFAMHFYGLIYAELAPDDTARVERFRERARMFARDFQHWFDEDGGTIAFGRSMTYRFACAGFWAGLAFAGEEALPWGQIKGHYLRHLRWWADKPITDASGVLSIGYGYSNLLMSENYNSAGSPYWAFKAFLPLALPADHPFWMAEEAPARFDAEPVALDKPGMVMQHHGRNVVALSSGQENLHMRFGSEKYAKFAYSSRYGFSVESDERDFRQGTFDNMLAFSIDGTHYLVRESNAEANIAGNVLHALWRPTDEIHVDTWLVPAGDWHIRIHRIRTTIELQIVEGGFAIPRADGAADTIVIEDDRAHVIGAEDFSGIQDLGSDIARKPSIIKAHPNTNLVAAKTSVPHLRGVVPPGETVLVTAVIALPDIDAAKVAWGATPVAPDIEELEELFASEGRQVAALALPGGQI